MPWFRVPAGTIAPLLLATLMATPLATTVRAQEPAVDVAELLREPDVARALSEIGRRHPQVLDWQRALARIPGPTGEEGARARYVQRQLEIIGLDGIHIDSLGNVLASFGPARARPRLLLSAHLDTVFPLGTPLTPREEGDRIVGPGVHDNARGLAVLLGVAEAVARSRIPLRGSLLFAATVGEEGLGDLRGMKALFAAGGEATGVDYVINVDGAGMDRIVNQALGSRRYRVTYKGPGGHSWNDYGLVNPANALGRAIARLAQIDVPRVPRSSLNIGRLGGGTSVNVIPQEAWMELDLRSVDPDALTNLEKETMDALVEALHEERDARGDTEARLDLDVQLVGERPAAVIPADAFLVRAALAVTRALGVDPVLSESSTDANVPLSRGIPAISLGGGGVGGRAHSQEEWFDPTEAQHGVERVFLLVLMLMGVTAPAA
jgi:acetylornithine deacetylase/succinyl-diaminopimelate desuccinylase-like protein